MQIYLGALDDSKWASNGAAWLTRSECECIFSELPKLAEQWREVFGPLDVYIEVTAPGVGKENGEQFDLLLVLPDRTISVEVKLYPSADSLLKEDRWREQLGQFDRQQATFDRILGYPRNQPVRTILWCPRLCDTELDRLRTALNNSRRSYIGLAGDEQHPTAGRTSRYLPNVVHKFVRELRAPLPGVQDALRKRITAGPSRPVTTANDLREVIEKIQHHRERHYPLPHQIDGLREGETAAAVALLDTSNVLQVVGTRGFGKTYFIEELLRRFGKTGRPTRINVEGTTTREIARTVLQDAIPLGATDREIAAMLGAQRGVIWVERYETHAKGALDRWLRELTSVGQSGHHWIIETPAPLSGGIATIELKRLSDDQIRQIISRWPVSKQQHNPTQVTFLANGNPGIAVDLWQREESLDSARVPVQRGASPDRLDFLATEGTERQRDTLVLLLSILDDSPCGLSLDALRGFRTIAWPDLSAQAFEDELQWCVKTVERHQLAHVYRVDRSTLSDEVVRSLELVVLNNIATDAFRVLGDLIGNDRFVSARQKRLTRLLELWPARESSLEQGALWVRHGKLIDFFWSPYALTHRGHVLRYLDRQPPVTEPAHAWVRQVPRLHAQGVLRVGVAGRYLGRGRSSAGR